jgi:hypothetical protein
VSFVAKVKDAAGGLYQQAKTKCSESEAVQKAGHQAGHAAGQVTDRIKDLAAKTTTAVKDARARGISHR